MDTGEAPARTFNRIRQSLSRLQAWPVRRVMQLMDRAVERGRNAVQGLRSANHTPEDLELALSRVRDDYAPQNLEFRIVGIGPPKPLKPPVLEEIYYIGREALINALRHSNATEIEIEAEYSPRRMRIVVRDNGCGIDPQVLTEGNGQCGLTGMRERAETIGARLQIWSRKGAGTEIEVTLPGHIAFVSRPTVFLRNAQSHRPPVTLPEVG